MKMRNLFCWILLSAILINRGLCVPTATEPTEEEDEWDDDDDSSEADDDGRIYKNPRNSPSTECPRDEEQATILGQKCLRKCSSDEDCKSKKKKCLCDGACGMSCIKPDRECPPLEDPALGKVSLSGSHFGSKATYTCDHGYHVVGLQRRLCQADGHWAGTEPACKQNIYCLTPPTVQHARHNALPEQATFDLDSTVQYHCHTGYQTGGFNRAKCLAISGQASWYGPDISCEPISCGPPPDPGHGWHAGECYTFGCRVTYHCGEGYELVGKQERFCQADGSWTPKELPTCVLVTAVQCAPPENPRNGKAIYTSTSYNSVVSYECRYGYTLVGESSRRCGADKKWSGTLPVCKEINCGHPGTLYNGWLENIESGTGLGASIIFRCHPEMLLAGQTSTVCQIDGRWRYALPQCLAPCVVPTILQGTIIPLENDNDLNITTTMVPPMGMGGMGVGSSSKVRHGTVLEVYCDEHYEFPLSSLSPPTCNNGTWSVIPRCVPARCKVMPKPPKNGMVLAPKTEHGMRARFKCKDGYNLTGPGGKEVTDPNEYVLTCSFGNWTGETPLCQEIYCSFPGYIPNGKVLLVGNMGLYDYRPYVKKIVNNKQIMYDCDKGYVLEEGPPGATCIGGVWRPVEMPSCLPGQHPRLRWNRRRRRSINLEMRFRRSNYLLRHYRELQRRNAENADYFINTFKQMAKREASYEYRGRRTHAHKSLVQQVRHKRDARNEEMIHSLGDLFDISLRRAKRDLSYIEKAYSKYYEKIKAKYRNYVKNLLGYHRKKSNGTDADYAHEKSMRKLQVQDGRWYNSYKDPDLFNRHRATHKARTLSKDEKNKNKPYEPYAQTMVYTASPPTTRTLEESVISIPHVTEYRTINYKAKPDSNRTINHANSQHQMHFLNQHKPITHSNNDWEQEFRNDRYSNINPSVTHRKLNMSSIIAQLQSQIVRRKRSMKNDDTQHNRKAQKTNRRGGAVVNQTSTSMLGETVEPGENIDLGKKLKFKGPCEPFPNESYIHVEFIRPSKDPAELYGPGTIVRITCDNGYTSNAPNPNATSKCVRGRWKPMRPTCTMKSCFVPSTEHGKYFVVPVTMPTDVMKPTPTPLTAMEQVDNGQTISFQCDQGYNIQGPASLKCSDSEWAVNGHPECLAAPCVLPPIVHAFYQGGYRAGLTIAHGSSVMVQCESGMGNMPPVQMDCALGAITPQIINCGFAASRKSREDDGVSNHIIEGGNFTSSEEEDSGRDCGPPARVQGSLVYVNGEAVSDPEESFPSGTEISFDCIASITGERTTWRIVCEDSLWIGRSLNCEGDESHHHHGPLINGSCIFRNNEPHVASFYNDLEIREEYVEFPPGTTIISRCVDIGKYAMIGSSVRTCVYSEWSGQKPSCFGLNQENDYAMEKPPTILIRHQNGPISQSNDGKLIVYPGTTVHMECLWMRRFGNPRWNVSHDYRKYPEGWSMDEGRDPQLEYRLSIIHAVKDDSGSFTCVTPARHTHGVDIIVKPVHCPEVVPRRGLSLSTTDTQMSTRVTLRCTNGNALIGAPEIVCLPSGNWSAPLPVCESVECGDVQLTGSSNGSLPRVAILSREVGGRAAFSCPAGYGLRGPSEAICLPTGEWGGPFPACVEVQCFHPGAPQNGYAQGQPPYRAGDVVQFNCNPEFMMQGQPIIACQDNGRWSGVLPKCVQACSYPGTAISGRMSSVKFYYSIGESITFTCDSGLEIRGAKMLKCLKNGKWSNAIPTCVNPDAIVHNQKSDAKAIFKRKIRTP